MAEEIKFEIVKKIGQIGQESKGWVKEVNLVSWNDRKPKVDIRPWSADHLKMGKGITLTKDELLGIKKLLEEIDINALQIE